MFQPITCSRCRQENPPEARFCLGCGARLALGCSRCGIELPGGARFCLRCGHPVEAGAGRFAAPEAYTPPHLAEKILTSRSDLQGERKQVTVLFADLKGSMELLADRDPEEARKILDPVLERMMEAVHRYEGTVNQVMGDGIMALFGAPLAHEDHAVRACYAALRMQDAVRRYAEEVRRSQGVAVRIRIGLNSGEVVVRAIGSDLRMDYTAVGQTTHLAARMEQLADPGSILLTTHTLALAEGFVRVRPLGPMPVKGLGEPVEVFELAGAGAARSRLRASIARGLTKFVGRLAEMGQLHEALERARAGHGQVVAIDRLPPEDKRLLQSAAVVGKDVPFPLLQAIADLPEEDLRRGLAHLQAGEFLYEASLFPDLDYTFKHALTHEVAYGGLLHDRRRALHGRIVQAMERLYADRLGEQADRLAHHAARGELWDLAVGYCRQAGLRAAQRLAHREAAAYFEQALQALGRLPGSRETRDLAVDLRVELRHSLMVLGQRDRILEILGEARALAQALGDRRRLASVASFLANGFYLIGDLGRAAEAAGEARAIAAALGDLPLEATASFYLGQAYQGLGDYRRAAEALRRNVKMLEAVPLADRMDRSRRLGRLFLVSRQWLVLTLLELGEFAEALRLANENEQLADRLGQTEVLIGLDFASGLLHIRTGDLERALSILKRAQQLTRTGDVPVGEPLIASHLGHAYTLLGRVGEAIALLEAAVEQASRMGLMSGQSLRVAWLGEAYLADERWEEAAREAERAVELARRHGERGLEGWALRLQGEAAARRDPPDVTGAEGAYRRALVRAEELGMRPLAAHCRLGLGRLLARAGQREEARGQLAAARGMLAEMQMRPWAEEAEAALGALG